MTGTLPPVSVSRPELLDPGGRDRSFRALVYDLASVGARMQEVRDNLAGTIAHMQDGAGVRSVARRLHVSGPFITAQVNVLVKAGLVAKHPNPEDGRAVILSLTDIGEARLEAIAPEIQRANDTFFGPLSASEFRLLAGLAARLVESSELAVRSGAD